MHIPQLNCIITQLEKANQYLKAISDTQTVSTVSTVSTVFVVEICRYGNLGETHLFGVFDETLEQVINRMKEYNNSRGGKYPVIKIYNARINQEKIAFSSDYQVIDVS